jgi:alkyl sulfatase BDS1-like metallo-beta-lactamase superfamily hydrolase
MGGADAVLAKAKESYDQGDFRWVAQVVNHVVFADPDNQEAKDLQADALEQLGYQAEAGPWRNFYLTGAKELREGVAELPTPNTVSPDTVRAMSPEMFFDYLGVRLDSTKAGDATAKLNIELGNPDGQYLLELENGVLNHTADARADDADATVTLTRDTLNDIILQQTTLADAISAGDVSVQGDQAKLEDLVSSLDSFEFWFDIVTP